MVQVPTTAGAASAHAMRASPAHTSRAGTPSKGKGVVNGNSGQADIKQEKPPALVILSALKSAPLDLASVERRGQPTATREHPKSVRAHGLAEAPTFYPTAEEFKNFEAYIEKIRPEGSQYGICKIVPPEEWNPKFAIDTERFHFKTRKQELNSIEGSTRANLTYLDQLQKFHQQHGNNLNKFPSVDKRPLDLYKLKKFVERRGGFQKVCQMKKWAEIGRDLGYSGKIMSSLSTSLKNSYQRWLEPYEEYLRHAKPGVQAQLELEYGGPLTPPQVQSPFKGASHSHQHTPSSLRNESPAIRASDALNASMHSAADMRDVPMLDPPNYSNHSTPAPQAPPRSGFTPVNAGGFTPVNSAPAGFTPVNRREREREPERSFTPPWHARDSPIASAKGTPEYKPSGLGGTPLTKQPNGITSNPSAQRQSRQESHDSSGSKRDTGTDGDENSSGRRSKRLKKETIPTVAGSHMSFLRPLASRTPGEPGYFAPGEKCEQCGKGDEEGGQLLLCDSCDHGYHMECLEPPLTRKPEYDWNCPRCLVGDGQFGFEEGGIYSLKQFQEKAAAFKENYFRDRLPFDEKLNCPRPVTEDDIEKEFWRLVASLEETVEVEYGADIHSTTHGSGFPTVEDKPDDPYACDPWNLNIMPMAGNSLFRHIKSDISGMTVPWLYVGMIFSTFCWHNEDHYAYSANYQHFGSTKTWYGIPGKDAMKFEEAMREAVPELFETQPDLLFQLVTLLTPDQLKKAGVEVYALDQRAGQFVITFPQAYHAGFNHGFNLNEAVNFAPKDWEPFGEAGIERLQQFRRQPCFSHDELLWTAAEGHTTGGVSVETAKWLKPALGRMRDRELGLRRAFHNKHYTEQPHSCVLDQPGNKDSRCYLDVEIDDKDLPEEEYQCAYCKCYAYLSRFKCKTSGKVLCLSHAGTYECCDLSESERFYGGTVRKGRHTLYLRRTEDAMNNMHQKISDKADLPEAWERKVNQALEDDAPSLKVLRTLLHEGDRIPYELPSYRLLKDYIQHCNSWVEEATTYLVRKQNRRKSEKRSKKANEAEAAEEKRLRNPENIERMLKKADELNFDSPEIGQLRDRSTAIKDFKHDAAIALQNQRGVQTTPVVEELLDRAYSLQVDLPEIQELREVRERSKWNDQANESVGKSLTLAEVTSLIEKAEALHIYPNTHELLRHFVAQKNAGELWEVKAKELMSADVIHYPQLQALSNQAQQASIPTTTETLAQVEQILNKQREAQAKIANLYDRTKNPDFSKRPKYIEVRDTMDSLNELNSKPTGTLDLEKEQKRHEDWMRKGKKLFGKANAPLHILKTHMEYVMERNTDCFDIVNDKPRLPAEPASREPSPEDGKGHSWEDPRFREVFCICRRVEAGMMIECEHCHEWYHGKCLKIARGKVKEDEKYMCPICDWRVKIPRDAARPKLEDLIDWQSEIATLPFQPEEEDILSRIIDNAQDFRNHVAPFCHPLTTDEETPVQRFYLRKIEGAEILLVQETNFFREQLHKWDPVADEPPPVLEQSKSTRKPRPTKLQKLMAMHGVKEPEDLPVEVRGLRTKMHRFGGSAAAGEKGTQSPQGQMGGQQQHQGHPGGQQRGMMGMGMGMGGYMPHQQPGMGMNGFGGQRYPDHGLGYGGPPPHQLQQTLAQLGHGHAHAHAAPHHMLEMYEQQHPPREYASRPLFEPPPPLGSRPEERDVERERGIERMFSDLTNTEDPAEERERADGGGGTEKEKEREVEGPPAQGGGGGQAEEFLSTMALYGEPGTGAEGEGSDSPRWGH